MLMPSMCYLLSVVMPFQALPSVSPDASHVLPSVSANAFHVRPCVSAVMPASWLYTGA